jgi:hypothetical protein
MVMESFRMSGHAAVQARRRAISTDDILVVMRSPEQKVHGYGGISCYQSRIVVGGRRYLLRILVDEAKTPPVIVTVYRTSRIAKYWSVP